MASVVVRAPTGADSARLADLHNDAFSDYPFPSDLDAAGLQAYMAQTDVGRRTSRVALVDGRLASFCLGAVRGRVASIRGEGTAVAHRRRGFGTLVLRETLAALRAEGAREVGLEVLDTNGAARALYEGHGFAVRRRLVGYELPRTPTTSVQAAVVEAGGGAERLRAWGWPQDAPWQLQPETLRHMTAWQLEDDAVAVGAVRPGGVSVFAVGVRPPRRRHGLARRLLHALGGSVAVPMLIPEAWSAGRGLLESMGASLELFTQFEMARGLL